MPRSPSRPCTYPGCGALVDGTSRCPQHQPPQRPRTFTRKSGGYDGVWRRIVADAIQAEPWCHWPAGCYATEDLTGDHITPLSKGGANTKENCRILCRRHNSQRGNRDAA